ncbi:MULTISPECIES: MetQ/NlpA family ABC transporter substrate-binding protein [unclassified Aureimonas]|uniref:MetQ/NlpA family ABC transporter substrate-binding protein n=1 Tax=unclassified Aureimonas TaxID=2615206 RepID=UPI0006F74C2A|nr:MULTISPECIES: MetQ/NlpA family ABC transporter substrate-binding protein [unclassified Aureimonas]KQT60487.1 metal ABC transporter substrate-binding protein [Aureimonas sp. Leaf427]KQT79364.1 metal ABC transporter substrate-binding protein [Aureimonas sp. Leaf460]
MSRTTLSLRSTSRRTLLAMMAAVSAFGLTMASGAAQAEEKTVKVGIISGEDEDVWKVVTAEAAKSGLAIETVVFNDYTQPNEALERGDIDANAFQHKPYLDAQIQSQGYKIVPAGYTAVWPIGLYSRKVDSVAALGEGSVVGVPNDPSNEGRALKLLEAQGLIKLKDGTGILATPADIAENTRKIEIKELDAGIIGRSVDDLDAAVVNTDWALKSGLKADEDRIAQEAVADNPYRNFIAVRTGEENEPWVKSLVAAYQNPVVKAEFERVYKGTGIPAY